MSLRRALPFVSRNSSLASTWCFIAEALRAPRSDLTAQFGCPLASRIAKKGDRKSETAMAPGSSGRSVAKRAGGWWTRGGFIVLARSNGAPSPPMTTHKFDRRTVASVSALGLLLSSGGGESSSSARAAEGGRERGGFFGNFVRANWMQARDFVNSGMRKFLDGDVEGSVSDFDRAIDLDPSQKPRLWQRGLSLYYAGEYEKAAEQFRVDVSLNPNDTEEALWAYLSEARLVGSAKAKEQVRFIQRPGRSSQSPLSSKS